MQSRIIAYSDADDLVRQLGARPASSAQGPPVPQKAPQVPQEGLLPKVGRFAAAMAKHITTGGRAASAAQVEARLAICRPCEFFDAGICLKCGCYLAIKTAWAEQSCPLDPPKWGPVVPEDDAAILPAPAPCCDGKDASDRIVDDPGAK